MKIFRIQLFLTFKDYLRSIVLNFRNIENKINKQICSNSKKKYFQFSNQLRVSFLILLKFLKKKHPKKKEIIFSSFNLEEMVEIAKNLDFKIKFVDINYNSGNPNIDNLKKAITKRSLAFVYTNMFNDYHDQLRVKKLCKKNKIIFIEDNAIYFDNYHLFKRKKIFSGSLGDYTLYSFNIMKNISGLYGGGISTNDKNFFLYNKKMQANFKKFPKLIYLKQNIIFLLLKLFSINLIYKYLFFNFVKYAHIKNNKTLLTLFYPSLRFKIKNIPDYYYSKISNLSKKLIYLQICNTKQRKINHQIRKKNNIYYSNIFNKLQQKKINLLNLKDFNYQNFLSFPILTENKNSLYKYLLNRGFELKYIHYKDCSKTFKTKGKLNINASLFEKKLLCLPNHSKINKNYIINVSNAINNFYLKNDKNKRN